MIIVESSCSGCTKCVAECYRKAIYAPGSNRYVIDEALCNDCADLFEVQCVRVCREGAIVRKEDYLNVIATAGLFGAHR